MANSSLATYTKLTANNSGARTQKISKITIHYMAARWTGKQCADYFYNLGVSGSRRASSNYCVGYDGSIAVSVNEANRAWTSSSEWNDQRAVTIECGNETDSSLSDACYKALIALCADICKRNNITPHYDGTQNATLTEHRMFASTDCPGSWIHKKLADGTIEKDILAAMGTTTSSSTNSSTESKYLYKVWLKFDSLSAAQAALATVKKTVSGAFVLTNKGTNYIQVSANYDVSEAEKMAAKFPAYTRVIQKTLNGVIQSTYKSYSANATAASSSGYLVKITADELNVRASADPTSTINTVIKKGEVYTIVDEKVNSTYNSTWGKLKSGAGWINLSYTMKV